MTVDQFKQWEDRMVASYERDRQAILAWTPKYAGTTVAPPSCRDVAEWPDWMLFKKLDADVAAYIVELRSRDELETSEVRELERWREIGDDDITGPEDVEEKLGEVDDIKAELEDLKKGVAADDELITEMQELLERLAAWLGEPRFDDEKFYLFDIRTMLAKAAAEEDTSDE